MAGLFDDVPMASGGGDQSQGAPLKITVRPQARQLDDRSRDLLVRTVLGEAAGEPDDGQRGVAAVILNRLDSGKWGKSVPSVVTAKSQFEPWMTPEGRKRMMGYAPDGTDYARAAGNVDAILGGEADPTKGATHFFSPTAQAALGRQPPSWAQGEPIAIGRHNFYSPDGGVKVAAAPNPTATDAATPATPVAAQTAPAAAPAPQASLFADVPVTQKAGGLEGQEFNDRFAGEGFSVGTGTGKLATELQRTADRKVVNQAYGKEVSDKELQFDTVVAEWANSFGMNVPRNLGAMVLSAQYGVPFDEAYQKLKEVEEARARLAPGSSIAGTGAGIVNSMAVTPGIRLVKGGAQTMKGRAAEAAVTGGVYGAASELFDSKDPEKAALAMSLSAAFGGIAAPVAEKIVGLVSKMVKAGKTDLKFLNPDGTLTDDAVKAAREAGIDPAELQLVMQRKFAETFERKGATPATAREAAADEFGIRLSPGQATGDFGTIAKEQAMVADAKGPLAGNKAREFFTEQEGQVTRAKGGVQERLAGGTPLEGSVNDAANTVAQGAKGKATEAKTQYKASYEDALKRDGEFNDIAFRDIGERIRREGLKAPEPVVIDDVTTPVAARAIQHLDANIGKVRIQDRAQPRSEEAVTAGAYKFPGEPERVGTAVPKAEEVIAGVNMRGVDQARKQLVEFYKAAKSSGNDSDVRAMRRIIAGFDDELETAIATGLFKGDEGALPALKKARQQFADYQKTFRSQGAGDDVGKAMEKIVARDATGAEVANMLWGKAAIGEKGDSVRLAGRLKQVFGENSDEWSAVRQGLWQRLTSKPEGVTDFGPQALSTRIFTLLNGDGADMAKVLFTPKEIGEMRRLAGVLKTMVPPKGATNPSGSGWALLREAGISSGLGTGTWFLTNDPATTAAITGARVGGKLAATFHHGRQAGKHFGSGAPSATSNTAVEKTGRRIGVGAGAAGDALEDQVPR